jgi:hypothetical protein
VNTTKNIHERYQKIWLVVGSVFFSPFFSSGMGSHSPEIVVESKSVITADKLVKVINRYAKEDIAEQATPSFWKYIKQTSTLNSICGNAILPKIKHGEMQKMGMSIQKKQQLLTIDIFH